MRTSRSATRWITRTALLLALTLAIQMLGLPQWVTGPAVNALLLISGLIISPASGVVIGLFTPIIAVWRGIVPPVLAPMVPFISAGNAVFVLLFMALRGRQQYLGLVLAAAAKFIILAAAVRYIVSLPQAVAYMMQFPQLVTALVGGAFALVIYELLKNTAMMN